MPLTDPEVRLSPPKIILSGWRCLQRMWNVLGRAVPDWPDADDGTRLCWVSAIEKAMNDIETTPEEGKAVSELAAGAHMTYQTTMPHDTAPVGWAELDPLEQLVWKCLVRHLFNALLHDPEEDGSVEQHEERMEAYFLTLAKQAGIDQAKDRKVICV